jgi:putative SOS response-associated peptidase YedK
MCGRFELHTTPARIKEYFELTGDLNFSPSWNIAPSAIINSIVADEDENRLLKQIYWGLIPSWAEYKTIAARLINARSETIH